MSVKLITVCLLVALSINAKAEPPSQEKIERYMNAATAGDPIAQHFLAGYYYSGNGLKQDFSKARYWWEKSANQGYALAQYSLGYLYDNGRGVTEDCKTAISWYKKAADQGFAEASYNLWLMSISSTKCHFTKSESDYWGQKAERDGHK